MHKKLIDLTEKDYWLYGLKESDFDYTFEVVKTFIANNQEKLRRNIASAKVQYPDESINCEIESDLAHYAWVNEQYLWQFCLWRLQGIFEGLILYKFLPTPPIKHLIGIKPKLAAAKKINFVLSATEEIEIMRWAKLRNALSHAPPEQYNPGPLGESDIVEYIDLLKSICQRWRAIKPI